MEQSQGTPQDTDMASPPSSFRRQTFDALPSTVPSAQQQSSQSQPGPESTLQTAATPKKQRVPDGYVYQAYYDPSRSRRHRHEQDTESAVFGASSTPRGNQASATRILELRGLERRIIQLLETAGQAIQLLSGDDDDDDDDVEDENDDEDGEKRDQSKQNGDKKEEKEKLDKKLISVANMPLTATPLKSVETQRLELFQDETAEKAARFEALAQAYATLVNEIQSGLRKQFHYLTKAGITSSQVPFKNVVYGEEKELETWLNAVDILKDSAGNLVDKIEHELEDPVEDMDQEFQ